MKSWQIPDVIEYHPRVTYCVELPDKPEYHRAFLDCMSELTRWFNWQRDTEHRAISVVNFLKNVLLPQEMVGFECMTQIDFRNNPFDACQIDISTDGQLTWRAAWRMDVCQSELPPIESVLVNTDALVRQSLVDRYTQGGLAALNPSTPLDLYSGDASEDREAALCTACKAYVTKISNDFHTRAGLALGLSAGLVGAGAFLGVIGIPAIVVGLVLLDASEQEVDATADPQAVNDVICCMVNGLDGQAITREVFQACLSGCGFTAGTHSADVRDIVEASFADYGNWIALLDALGNAYDVTSTGARDCPCGETCNVYPEGDWNVTEGIVDEETDVITADGLNGVVIELALPVLATVNSIYWVDSDTGSNVQRVAARFYNDDTLIREVVFIDHYANSDWEEFTEPPFHNIDPVTGVNRVEIENSFYSQSGIYTAHSFRVCWE